MTINTYAHQIYTANEDFAAVMPWATAAEKTHGTEILCVTVAASVDKPNIKIEFDASGVHKTGDAALVAALFIDDELCARRTASVNPPKPEYQTGVSLRYGYSPKLTDGSVDTTLHMYRIRVGPAAGVIRLNGFSGGTIFGGTQAATLFVEAK